MKVELKFDTSVPEEIAHAKATMDAIHGTFTEPQQEAGAQVAEHTHLTSDAAITAAQGAAAAVAPGAITEVVTNGQSHQAAPAAGPTETTEQTQAPASQATGHDLKTLALDSQGRLVPWDKRIHSGGQKRLMSDGKTWKKRIRPKELNADQWAAEVTRVENEIVQLVGAAPAQQSEPTQSMFAASDAAAAAAGPTAEQTAADPNAWQPPTQGQSFPEILQRFHAGSTRPTNPLTQSAFDEILVNEGIEAASAGISTATPEQLAEVSQTLSTMGF